MLVNSYAISALTYIICSSFFRSFPFASAFQFVDKWVTPWAGWSASYPGQNGYGESAGFNTIKGIVSDSNGNVFVVESGNNQIRRIDTTQWVTTIAGSSAYGHANGVGTFATFNSPNGIALDAYNNIYVADQQSHAIRKIMSNTYVVSTIIGSLAATPGKLITSPSNTHAKSLAT